jgi:hypothetical protein
MGCGASKPAPFDWANQSDPRPRLPAVSVTPTDDGPQPVEDRATLGPNDKVPPTKKLIRTNTSMMGAGVEGI